MLRVSFLGSDLGSTGRREIHRLSAPNHVGEGSTDSADAVIQSFWEGEVEADGWELRDDRLRGRR